jgi:Alpha-2,8-polysialyltransferase (POLYST)
MSNTIIFASHKYAASINIVKPLISFLEKNDYDIVFIHINNVTGKYETENDLNFRHFDLSLTDPKIIMNFIDEEKPCLLICLEFTSLFIILLIRLAKLNSIKTLYFEHGIFIKGHGDKFLLKKFNESLIRYFIVSKIYLKYIIIYKMSLLGELKTICQTFVKRNYSGLFDVGLFYSQTGFNMVKDKFNLPPSGAFFAGYPITATNDEIRALRTGYAVNSNVVLFIHQPLIQDKLSIMSYAEEMEMFYEINEICSQQELNLIIKLHPRADFNFYSRMDTHKRLHFTTQDFGKLLVNTKTIIGQFSTALFNGIVLNIPIIIIPYRGVKSFYYDDFIDFSIFLDNVTELGSLLDQIKNNVTAVNKRNIKNKDLCGEINSFENQADKIVEIILFFTNEESIV